MRMLLPSQFLLPFSQPRDSLSQDKSGIFAVNFHLLACASLDPYVFNSFVVLLSNWNDDASVSTENVIENHATKSSVAVLD
jgi:hypothetical protein